jgi:hypothetical protein
VAVAVERKVNQLQTQRLVGLVVVENHLTHQVVQVELLVKVMQVATVWLADIHLLMVLVGVVEQEVWVRTEVHLLVVMVVMGYQVL